MNLETLQNGLGSAVYRASALIPPYDVRDDLSTMTDQDMIRHYRTTGRIIIWSGFSDRTIFGAPRINWQFRAWHDYCHILSGVCNRAHGPLGCFEPIAEYAVADYQCKGLGDSLARIVQCEVAEQARHFERTGSFIADQISFTLDLLSRES